MVKKIILGTAQFGLNYGINNTFGKPSEKMIFEMLDYANNQGINILDTADAYGNASEIIGKYISQTLNKFEINTKFKTYGSSVTTQLEASLISLNSDNINVYFFHSFDDFINFPNLQKQLLELKEIGKLNKIGLSVYENNEFKIACESDRIDVIQFPFNLLDNLSQRDDLIRFAKNRGKELQVRSVFLQGLFFKPLTELPPNLMPLKPYLESIQDIALRYQISVEQLALSYVLQQTKIDNVIIGVDSIHQLKKNIKMSKIVIVDEIIEVVSQINVKEVRLLYPKNW